MDKPAHTVEQMQSLKERPVFIVAAVLDIETYVHKGTRYIFDSYHIWYISDYTSDIAETFYDGITDDFFKKLNSDTKLVSNLEIFKDYDFVVSYKKPNSITISQIDVFGIGDNGKYQHIITRTYE